MSDTVEHPAHYGGEDDPYEVIKVAEAWGFDGDAYLFNVLKYIRRDKDSELEDLKKALFYLKRKIDRMEQTAAEQAHALGTLEIPELVQKSSPHSRRIYIRLPGVRSHTHYTAYAREEWLIETLASLVATGSKQKAGSLFGIAVRKITADSVEGGFLPGVNTVAWMLETYPPEDYEYHLRKKEY